jgi:uncharacterized protein YbjT (DUF2867 family)
VCLTPDAQATGNVGRHIVDALVAASFAVTVGTRHVWEDVDSKFPPSVSVKTVDLEHISSLATAFAGQDAIVEAFNPTAARFQINVVRAAMQSGVKHIITPDFSGDTFHVNAPELKIFEPKIEAQRLLEESLSGSSISGCKWIGYPTRSIFIQSFYIAALSRYFYPSFHSGILDQCEQLEILFFSYLLSPLT